MKLKNTQRPNYASTQSPKYPRKSEFRTSRFGLLWVFRYLGIWAFLSPCASLADFSTDPPRVYSKTLARRLTPIEDVIDKPAVGVDDDTNIVAVLREHMHYVEGSGKIWKLRHNAFRATNEAGVDVLKEQTVNYRRTDQRIYLLMARTILPDGRKIDIEDRAAFVKTPQQHADVSLYTDNAELTIIFPNVVKGAVIEYIAMVEDRKPVIGDDAYVAHFFFDNYWPTVHVHQLVDLPSKLAERLHIHTLGDIPEPTREKAGWRRTRLQWAKTDMAAIHWEPEAPSLAITGPALKLTTFADWDEFAAWYRDLLKKPSELTRELEQQVDAWTADLSDPHEILATLLHKVSVDIRYTGLEFGIGGYQPRSCAEIWDKQYGDCKDKSNLLRVMLARKGIESHLALLNTEGRGQLDRQAPYHGQFNHVILAVKIDDQYIFCDPTIPYLAPGQLDSGDLDRELLLVKPDGHEFVRTPQQSLGTLRVDFELKYEPDARLSGWMTLAATEVWAARYAEHFWDMDRRATRLALHASLQGFYPGAQLIDFEAPDAGDWDGSFEIRAYFIVPGTSDTDHAGGNLRFPEGGYALPELGDSPARSTVFPQSLDTIELAVQYRLPAGWSATSSIKPYEVDIDSLAASATWTVEGNHCRAELSCSKRQAVVSPNEYRLLYNAVTGLRAWVEQTLPVRQGAETPAPGPDTALDGFHPMPSADGQMALLYALFPEDGSIELRRAALNKVLQWFPNERANGYTARVELARLLQREEKWAESERMVSQLLESYAGDIDQEARSWGEYLLASAALKLDRRDEGIAKLEAIAANEANGPFRRGWAFFDAAREIAKDDPERAINLLWKALEVHSPIYRHIARQQAQYLLEHDKTDDLPKLAALFAKADNRGAEAAISTLLDLVQWQLGGEQAAGAKALWAALEPLREQAHLGALAEHFDATADAVANAAKQTAVKDALSELFATRAPAWWADIEIDESWDGPALDKQLMMAVLGDDLRRYIRLQVEALLRFPQTPDHFSERLWRVLARLPGSELEGELLPELLLICDLLPESNAIRVEAQFIKGEWLSGKGETEGARKVYEAVLAGAEDPGFIAASHWRLGLLEAAAGQLDAARAHFAKGAALLEDAGEPAISCTLRGIYLNLESGDYDAAIAGIDSLIALSDDELKDIDSAARIQELITLATVPELAKRYWASHASWWPLWTGLADSLKLPTSSPGKALPNPEELRDMIARAVRANDRKAAGEALVAIMHSARWQPAYSLLANSMHILVRQLAPGQQQAFRSLNAAMQEAFESPDPEQMQQAKISLAAVRLDSADYEGAAKVIADFFETYGDEAARAPVMARLQALHAIASNSGIESAVARVEAILAKTKAPMRRPLITSLADLYRQQNRVADEVALLKAELADSGVAGPIRAELERRLTQIETNSNQSADFSAAASAWIAERDLPWLDFAKPANLAEIRDPRDAHANPGRRSPFEQFKLNILIAQAADQPRDLKIDAFDDVVRFLVALAQWREQANAIYHSLLANEAFDERLKLHWLWTAITESWIDQDFDSLAEFADHPLSGNFNDRQKRSVHLWRGMAPLETADAATISAYCKDLMTKPLGTLELSVLQMLTLRLLNLGDIEAAQAIESALADVPLASEVEEPRLRLRLRFKKMIRLGADFLPAHVACREALFARYPEADIAAPEHWARLRTNTNLDLLSETEAHQTQLYSLKQRQAMPTDFSTWTELAQTEYHRGDKGTFSFEILRATLDKLKRDEYLSEVIFPILFAFDIDDKAQIASALEACAPYRDPRAYPLTFAQIRLYEIMHGLRTGAELDLETELAGINHPAARRRAPHLILRHHLQRQDLPRLRRYLTAMDIDELISSRNVSLVLPALRAVGMTDEAELVAESAEKALYEAILESWATGEAAGTAYSLLDLLDRDATALPEGWLDSILARNTNSKSRRSLQVLDAELRKDWASARDHAADLLKTHPTYYHYYWQHGRASFQLGEHEAALKSLQTYVTYAKDTLHYPEARALIEKIEAAGE
jgi:hypothetical protein